MVRQLVIEDGGRMAEFVVNTRELVERLWAEAAAESALQEGFSLDALPDFERLTHHEERRYLNAHCVFDRSPSLGGRGGLLAGFKERAKARGGRFVMHVLQRYFDQDQEFRAHLVRLQNTLTDEHDRARMEVRQVHESFRAETARMWQACAAMHRALEDRVEALEVTVSSTTGMPGR
jgi:hypothetical protein